MIRFSSNTLFEQGVLNLQRGQADVFRTQDQIATGRRVRTPADDPVLAARALEVEQSQAINEQYMRNGDSAQTALGLSENALTAVTRVLQDARVLAVNAGNAVLSERELDSIGNELRALYQELLGLANSSDGNGLFLFSGFRGNVQPFVETAPGSVQYQGDQGQRLIQVSASRQVPVSDAGSDIFQLIRNGNGSFVTGAASANAGTGVIDPGNVIDAAAWSAAGNPRDFTVVFHVDSSVLPPVTTYDIVDNASGLSLTTGAAAGVGPYLRTYTEGANVPLATQAPPDTNPIPFDWGAQIAIGGQPASGDSFTVQASTNQDMFETLDQLILAVENAQRTPSGNARLANDLNLSLSNLDNALDNALRVRASVGSRLKEVDAAQATQADLVGQYQDTLSELRDLDYAKAISDLTRQQLTYEAAQKSFVRVQSLSLFNYL